MYRRGPDANGCWQGIVNERAVTLLSTRLAIVDLEHRADQPFESDGLVLVHNGKIYNHIELRRKLEALGHTFQTTSDTEVILKAYREWGTNCVDHFEGMWAFAIADRLENRVFLSRDRFGEKPFYLWPHEGASYFGSEIKTMAALAWAGAFRQLRTDPPIPRERL